MNGAPHDQLEPKRRVARVVGLSLAALTVASAAAFELFSVKSYGYPVGASARSQEHVATLMKTTESYVPSLHRDPTKDRYRLELLLHPLDGGAPRRLVRLAGGLQLSPANFRLGVLGADADLFWLIAPTLMAFDVKAHKLITEKDLQRINPELGELVQNGLAEFDGQLRLSSRDNRQVVAFDPVTLKAQASALPKRSSPLPAVDKPDAWLCAGAFVSPTSWLGLRSPLEFERDFKPGASVSGVYAVERSKQPRRMTQLSVDASAPRPHVVTATQLGNGEFIDAAFIRSARGAPALRLAKPDGYLLVYRGKPGFQASWVVARVDLAGQLQWKADTGIADLDQILPGTATTLIRGLQPKLPDKLQEPALTIIRHDTGALTRHALVQR